MKHFEVDTQTGGIVARLLGSVDSMNFDPVIDEIKSHVEEICPLRLLVDFTGIGMLQSSRLTRLIRLADACRAVGCELQLCGLQEYCRRVLTVTQLDRVVQVFSTERDALATWTVSQSSEPASESKDVPCEAAAPVPRNSHSGTPNLRRAIRLRRDETAGESFDWGSVRWKVGPPANGSEHNRVALLTVFAHQGEPFHRHTDTEEIVIVQSGAVEYWIDRYPYDLSVGDTVTVPPGVVHGCFNAEDEASELLIIHSSIPDAQTRWLEEDVSSVAPWKEIVVKRGYGQFDIHWKDSTMILHLRNSRLLDAVSVDEFSTALSAVDDEHRPEQLVIDLADVTFIASSVLGVLTRQCQTMLDDGRILRLCNLSPQVREVFEITKLSRIIPLHDSVGAAVASFV